MSHEYLEFHRRDSESSRQPGITDDPWSDLEQAVLECHRNRWASGDGGGSESAASPEASAAFAVRELHEEFSRAVTLWLAHWGYSYPPSNHDQGSAAVREAARRLIE